MTHAISLNKDLDWRNVVGKSALAVLGGSVGLSVSAILKNHTKIAPKRANMFGIIAGCAGAIGMSIFNEAYCQKNRLKGVNEPIFIKD